MLNVFIICHEIDSPSSPYLFSYTILHLRDHQNHAIFATSISVWLLSSNQPILIIKMKNKYFKLKT